MFFSTVSGIKAFNESKETLLNNNFVIENKEHEPQLYSKFFHKNHVNITSLETEIITVHLELHVIDSDKKYIIAHHQYPHTIDFYQFQTLEEMNGQLSWLKEKTSFVATEDEIIIEGKEDNVHQAIGYSSTCSKVCFYAWKNLI